MKRNRFTEEQIIEVLTIIEMDHRDVTKECLAAVPDTSLSGKRVVRDLATLIARRGRPTRSSADAPLIELMAPARDVAMRHSGDIERSLSKGVHNVERLLAVAEGAALPESARNPIKLLAEQFRDTQMKIEDVTVEIRKAAENDEGARRLQTLVTGSGLARMTCSGGAFQPEQGPECKIACNNDDCAT